MTEEEMRNIIRKEYFIKMWNNDGYLCVILRHPSSLHLCGYVGLKKQHELYEKHYDSINIVCHGGLTFASKMNWYEIEDLWFIGFDCAHHGDITPSYMYPGEIHAIYRNMEYVTNEVNSIVEQLKTSKNLIKREDN